MKKTNKKQTCYFSSDAFALLAVLRTFYQPKMSVIYMLGMRLNNQLILWCI